MRTASTSRLQLMWACAAVIAGFLCAAACAHAQGQPWRHGIIEPKSDAGFQVMAVRGGFAAKQGLKLELPYFQNDVIALRALRIQGSTGSQGRHHGDIGAQCDARYDRKSLSRTEQRAGLRGEVRESRQ